MKIPKAIKHKKNTGQMPLPLLPYIYVSLPFLLNLTFV